MTEIYLSTGALQTTDLAEILKQCLEHGIEHVELSSGVEYRPNPLEPVWASIDGKIKYLIHNYFPTPEKPFVLNLASSDAEILQRSIDFCKAALDLTSKLGGPFYSVHSGFAMNLTPDLLGNPSAQSLIPSSEYTPYATAYAIFAGSVEMLTKYAASKGVRLLIENNVVSPHYLQRHAENGLLMASADEIIKLMQDLNDPNLGLLVDVGHVNVSATALGFDRKEFMESVAPYIGAFHLSGNDGILDQNLPFNETDWFCPILHEFSRDLPLVIEAYKLSWAQIQEQYQVLDRVLV